MSSQAVTGTEEDLRAILEEKLAVLLRMAQEGELPFAYEEVQTAVDAWKEAGYPACRHSEEVRRAWAPAYRVIHNDYLRILHLLAERGVLATTNATRLAEALEGTSETSVRAKLGEMPADRCLITPIETFLKT